MAPGLFRDMGYGGRVPAVTDTSTTTAADRRRIDLAVDGMTCASCAARIERSLAGLPGVAEARANYGTKQATVVYDPDATGTDDFEAKIAGLGYSVAHPVNYTDREHED